MRKIIVTVIALFSLSFVLTACGGGKAEPTAKPSVVAEIGTVDPSPAAVEEPVKEEPVKEEPVKEEPVSLNGTWSADIFEATVTDDTITINIVDETAESSSLYWKGTFSAESKDVTSEADREALDASLMGSQDNTKEFTVTDDSISFKFTMMGTTKTVHLKR